MNILTEQTVLVKKITSYVAGNANMIETIISKHGIGVQNKTLLLANALDNYGFVEFINRYYSHSELKTIAFDYGIDYNMLGINGSKQMFAAQLLATCYYRGVYANLNYVESIAINLISNRSHVDVGSFI